MVARLEREIRIKKFSYQIFIRIVCLAIVTLTCHFRHSFFVLFFIFWNKLPKDLTEMTSLNKF